MTETHGIIALSIIYRTTPRDIMAGMKTYAEIIGALARYEVNPDSAHLAATALANGSTLVLDVAGKMGSGKDSTASEVIRQLGLSDKSQHVSFAAPLKREVSEAITFIAANWENADIAEGLAVLQKIKLEDSQFIVKTLFDDVVSGTVKTAWDRTVASRTALQYWGTEIRRTQDEDYWVKKAIAEVSNHLANGNSVYVTDARFVNEAESLRSIGAFLVRLEITREEQDRRIFSRDGILPTEEARNHASETSLDDYKNFDLVIDGTPDLSLNDVSGMIVDYITTSRKEVA